MVQPVLCIPCGDIPLEIGRRTLVMGILNITPDSFSDGGRFYENLDTVVAAARQMVAEGADILDVGGESTRPGAPYVPPDEELRRVIPAIEAVRAALPQVPLSIDTYKSQVARVAIRAGATMINDVWGLQHDPHLARVAAEYNVPVVVMHRQEGTAYRNLLGDIADALRRSVQTAAEAGLPEEMVIVDPGWGAFGKTPAQSLELLRRLGELRALGRPILIGTSRKSPIGKVLDLPVEERLEGTAATVALAIAQGAEIIRVHDVKEMTRVARMTDAVVRGWEEATS